MMCFHVVYAALMMSAIPGPYMHRPLLYIHRPLLYIYRPYMRLYYTQHQFTTGVAVRYMYLAETGILLQ